MFSVRGSRVLLARVISGSLLASLLLAGCTTGDREAATPAGAGASSSGSPSADAVTDAACTVPDFTASSGVSLKRVRPVVVYARSYTLPPGGSVRTSGPAPAERFDYVPIGTHAAPDSARLTDGDRDDILVSMGTASAVRDGRLPERVLVRVRLANHTQESRSYLVYRGATARSGTWRQEVCGAPYNDGTRSQTMQGTFNSVGRLTPVRTAICGVVPPHADAIARYAARRACV